jgi:hypothetical protein
MPGTQIATNPYAPDLRTGGDVEVLGGAKLRFTGKSLCPELNAAVSPLSHLGLMGSYRRDYKTAFHSLSGHDWNPNPYFNQELWEVGAGYYTPIDSQTCWLGIYSGYTQGWTERRDDYLFSYRKWNDDLDVTFHRFWVQAQVFHPIVGERQSAIGFVARFSLHTIDGIQSPRNLVLAQDYTAANYGLVDVSFLLQTSWKFLKLQLQTGISMPTDAVLGKTMNLLFGLNVGVHRPHRQR